MSDNPVLDATARLARVHSRLKFDPVEDAAARRGITEAKLRRAVGEALAAFPPLTDDVKSSIAHLLTAGGN